MGAKDIEETSFLELRGRDGSGGRRKDVILLNAVT